MTQKRSRYFALVFAGKTSLRESYAPETRGQVWHKEDLSLVEEDQVREHLKIWTYLSLRCLMACTHECSGSWLMSLRGHF